MSHASPPPPPHVSAPSRADSTPYRGPIEALLQLFSSIWLGVILLALLFIYSAIGSSGVPTSWNILDPAVWLSVRQFRIFEMTEFEWFHWWPFDLLIALICLNLIVATLRRIKLTVTTVGVWMIHAGIITLALGSVWYFSTKVEGLSPVNRRRVVIEAPSLGIEKTSMLAAVGNSVMVGEGSNAYTLRIADIDPQWELLSGDEKGQRAYKVSVMIQSRAGLFMRELIANRPQYTQDVVRTGDPNQPMQRAIKALGKPLVDEALQVSLEYDPQEYFYLNESHAIYLREVGSKQWVQRPIEGLPRYNDYIAAAGDVFGPADAIPRPQPLHIAVPPVEAGDPLPEITLNVSRFLRYANIATKRLPVADGPFDPTITISIKQPEKPPTPFQLIALDPNNNTVISGAIQFRWVSSADQLAQFQQRREPVISFSIPEAGVSIDAPIREVAARKPDLEFTPIAGTEYSYRVESFMDDLDIGSVAVVRLRTPQRTFERWVFDDPSRNRDMALAEDEVSQHGAVIPLDGKINTVYKPGAGPPAPIMILAGPAERELSLLITRGAEQPQLQKIDIGQEIKLMGGLWLTVDRYEPRTISVTRPEIVPELQRERDIESMMLIGVDIPGGTASQHANTVGGPHWLRFHVFPRPSAEETPRPFYYLPTTITAPDGRQIEMMFARKRMKLPSPVVLDDFMVASHIGGFTGSTSSILDWISHVRFENDVSSWGEVKPVQVNKPAEHEGFWYFQAQWDAPDRPRFQGDPGSRGLNYTVLGVGNRNGVHVQLAGCIIAVIGMMYAFYVKPLIKRRRQQAASALAQRQQQSINDRAEAPEPQLAGAALRVQS